MRIVDSDDEPKEIGEKELEYRPATPDHSMSDEEVEELEFEYSVRAPGDYVVSGPLGAEGRGPGHRFSTVQAALIWLTRRIGGNRIKQRIHEAESGGRWAFLCRPKEDNER